MGSDFLSRTWQSLSAIKGGVVGRGKTQSLKSQSATLARHKHKLELRSIAVQVGENAKNRRPDDYCPRTDKQKIGCGGGGGGGLLLHLFRYISCPQGYKELAEKE